jgi:glycosyltransferase involved in cell wall biosynthesis
MLVSLGHRVTIYGCKSEEGPTPVCTDFVETHTLSDIRKEFGSGDNRFEIGYNWHEKGFVHDFNKPRTETTRKFYAKCIEEINKTKQPDDFLLLTQGIYHKPVDDAVKLYLTCEPGIGYRGSYAKYRAFESSYIQNFTYGSANPYKSLNGNYFDRVIPNYFDPDDIEFSDKKENYFLYIGRVIKRKGVITAYLISKELGIPLIIAGQDGKIDTDGSLYNDFRIPKGNWEYIGFADLEKRKKLMAHARATVVATEYLEPFAGTHVESILSGTPVITTNFGVFPETVKQNITGFRCDTLNDFIQAGRDVVKLNPNYIRAFAERFLMDNVKMEFQKWFTDLYRVWESTQNDGRKGWHYIKK